VVSGTKWQEGESMRQRLFTEQVKARGRTYFFDVRETKGGGRYLVISESRRTEAGHERNRVVVFPDQVGEFEEALRKAAQALRGGGPQRAAKPA
jgi:hypothetical protein